MKVAGRIEVERAGLEEAMGQAFRVGGEDHQGPLGTQDAPALPQQAPRVVDVLDHVAHHDRVEAALVESQRLEPAQMDGQAFASRIRHRAGVEVHPLDLPAEVVQHLQD